MDKTTFDETEALPAAAWSAAGRIAARVAGAAWGEVQNQGKLARGVFEFHTAGHGGIVAVLDTARIDPRFVDVARACGLTEWWVEVPRGLARYSDGSKRWVGHYIRGPFAEKPPASESPEAFPRRYVEVWGGEEDCDYATILLACRAARIGYWKRRWSGTPSEEDIRACVERWRPTFLTEVLG